MSNEKLIKAVILAGRRDFGRCPVTTYLPTALWPLAGKSVLENLLIRLSNEGIKQATICARGDSSLLVRSIQTDCRLELKFLDEQLLSGIAGCIYDICSTLKIDTQVVNPNTQAWRWKNVKNKNDKKDALKLVQLSAMNQLPTIHMPKPVVRQKRALIHYRQTLVTRVVQIKNNIRAILNKQVYLMAAGKSGWTSKSIERLNQMALPIEKCDVYNL